MSRAKVDIKRYLEATPMQIKTGADFLEVASEARRVPDVAGGRELEQALSVAVRDIERTDERVQSLSRDPILPARERLEFLVGLLLAVAPHYGLDRFGQHLPGALEILADPLGAGLDLCKSGETSVEREQCVA